MFAGSWVNKCVTDRCCKVNMHPNRSSAVISIGAATLADIFDPAVRGKKVRIERFLCVHMTDIVSKLGIYYIAPLLGPVFFTLYRMNF